MRMRMRRAWGLNLDSHVGALEMEMVMVASRYWILDTGHLIGGGWKSVSWRWTLVVDRGVVFPKDLGGYINYKKHYIKIFYKVTNINSLSFIFLYKTYMKTAPLKYNLNSHRNRW